MRGTFFHGIRHTLVSFLVSFEAVFTSVGFFTRVDPLVIQQGFLRWEVDMEAESALEVGINFAKYWVGLDVIIIRFRTG